MEFKIRPEGDYEWREVKTAADIYGVPDELLRVRVVYEHQRPPLKLHQHLSAEIILNSSITDSLDILDS